MSADASRGTRGLPTWLLFFGPAVIWGTTWWVIKLQLGVVPPEVSVVYRFALSSAVLFIGCALFGVSLRLPRRIHARLVVLGLLQYGVNYVFVYESERYIASGLVAVVFALMVALNLIGARIFFGRRLHPVVVVGAVLGMIGVALVFWREVSQARGEPGRGLGIAFAVVSTVIASAGNLWAERVYSEKISLAPTTAWAMLYATIAVALYCAARGLPFVFDTSARYLLSLAYLAVFGSVVAFLGYLGLLRRLGAARASYMAVVIPILAMLTSTVFEKYEWSISAVVGLALVIAGNVMVLRARERIASV